MNRVLLLARSMAAGGAATIVDLGAMIVMVSVAGVPPRIASIPALAIAGAVNFGASHLVYLTWSFPMFRRVFTRSGPSAS